MSYLDKTSPLLRHGVRDSYLPSSGLQVNHKPSCNLTKKPQISG